MIEDLELIDLEELPLPPCIYFLLDENEQVVYVGQTNNSWMSRIVHHKQNKTFRYVKVMPVSASQLTRTETDCILKYQPKYNRQLPGDDRYISSSQAHDEYGLTVTNLGHVRFWNAAVEVWPNKYSREIIEEWFEWKGKANE